MRTTIRFITGLGLALVGAWLMAATAAAQDAKILKIVSRDGSSPTVTINGQSQPAREQQALPQSATIQTTAQEVYIEVVTGVVASVRPNSSVVVEALNGTAPTLHLTSGSLVSQIDKKRATGKYQVRTANGVAAARGTSFTVTVNGNAFSVTTTADSVQFTTSTGTEVVIRAGTISIGGQPALPLATAAQTNPEVRSIVTEAVNTVSTVVQENLGSMSADTATNLVTQVVAVASAAVPSEAGNFAATAVRAVVASTSSVAGTTDGAAIAAGAITAAAVKSAPDQAAQIAGAAAAAAPGQAGVITASAQSVAPAAKDAITQQVATATGQSTNTVQSNADASTSQATNAVNTMNQATREVVQPPTTPSAPSPGTNQSTETQQSGESQQSTTPGTPVDPSINVSPAT